MASKSPRKHKSSKADEDTNTVDSSVSMISRVSKVETDIGDVKLMLQRLVAAHCGTCDPPAQRSCNDTAGLSTDNPANGV